MTTSMRTLRNAVFLAVGVMLVLVLVDQSQASAGNGRYEVIGRPPLQSTSGSTTTEAPYVTQVSPQDGATGVSRTTNVKVSFSEPVDPTTVEGGVQLDNYFQLIPATISKDPTDTSGRTWVVDPYGSEAGRLDPNRQYRVRVEGWTASTFTTAALTAPYVTQVSPPNGATGVPTNTNIKVTFSEEMDPSTINSNNVKVTVIYYRYDRYDRYTNSYNYVREVRSTTISKDPADPSGRTWVVDPSLLLRTNAEVEVEIGPGVKDLSDGLSINLSRTYFKTASW
jgi:hypothetical protein